jgi:hypothetical protein
MDVPHFAGSRNDPTGFLPKAICRSGTKILRPRALSDIEDRRTKTSWIIRCSFRRYFMTITTAHIPALAALVAGILILMMPRLLNLVVAIYLICTGLIGLGLLKWLHI